MSGSDFKLIAWRGDQGKRVFCDLKFFDVPETALGNFRETLSL